MAGLGEPTAGRIPPASGGTSVIPTSRCRPARPATVGPIAPLNPIVRAPDQPEMVHRVDRRFDRALGLPKQFVPGSSVDQTASANMASHGAAITTSASRNAAAAAPVASTRRLASNPTKATATGTRITSHSTAADGPPEPKSRPPPARVVNEPCQPGRQISQTFAVSEWMLTLGVPPEPPHGPSPSATYEKKLTRPRASSPSACLPSSTRLAHATGQRVG